MHPDRSIWSPAMLFSALLLPRLAPAASTSPNIAKRDCTIFTPSGKYGAEGYLTSSPGQFRVSEFVDCPAGSKITAHTNTSTRSTTSGCSYLQYAMGLQVLPFVTTATNLTDLSASSPVQNITDNTVHDFLGTVASTVDAWALHTDLNQTIVMNYTSPFATYSARNTSLTGYFAFQPMMRCFEGTVDGCDAEKDGAAYENGTTVTVCGFVWYGTKEAVEEAGSVLYDGVNSFVKADDAEACCRDDEGTGGRPQPEYDDLKGLASTSAMGSENGVGKGRGPGKDVLGLLTVVLGFVLMI